MIFCAHSQVGKKLVVPGTKGMHVSRGEDTYVRMPEAITVESL